MGDAGRAIADYDAAIRLNFAYNSRGIAHQFKDCLDKAIADCKEAIRHDPNYANGNKNRRDAYEKQRSAEKATKDYRKALELDPAH